MNNLNATEAVPHHVVPSCDDRLHVEITRKERDDAVRDNLAILNKNASKIPNYCWVVSYFKARAYCDLIATSRDYLLIWSVQATRA